MSGSSPVLVVMAVFRPDADHLRAQIASLAAQSHRPHLLVAVIADTVSYGLVRDLAAEADLPLTLVETGMELDAVRAFEAGLGEALTRGAALEAQGAAPLIALCDQDDIWDPDKLERSVAKLAGSKAQMVHSDARLVAGDGQTVLRPSMFAFERRHRKPGLRGLLYRNNITGMTLLMRLQVARLALPFPPQSGVHFYHDLWLGLVAASTGGVALIDRPLVNYRQHGTNAIGAVDREAGYLRSGSGRSLPNAMWLRRESAAYALARYLAQSLQNRLVEAVDDGRLAHGVGQTRTIRAYLSRSRGAVTHLWDALKLLVTGHTTLARIAGGFAVVSAGRTVWTMRHALTEGRDIAIEAFDTRLYSLSPGLSPRVPQISSRNGRPRKSQDWKKLVDLRKTPDWRPVFTAEAPAVTVLVPTLNPSEIFAGIVTALDIGLGLAARGRHVRFIATDLPVSSPGASRSFLMRRLGQVDAGIEHRVSLHCGISEAGITAHKDDVFLATAWWSAHVAHGLIRDHGFTRSRFLYLIQDFEPNFYPWGPEYAGAMESYGFDFKPLFNTTLLRDYFVQQGFGFARGAPAFHPAIDIARYADQPRKAKGPRRLALYGRPEVARNMYATAIEALAAFVHAENLRPADIEMVSIGLHHADVALPGGVVLRSLGKLPWDEYPAYLAGTDLGLSLMYSPHPSHPPLEMAASGVRVVTNRFGPKDLGLLSPTILSVAPTASALAEGLRQAWAETAPVADASRRIDLTALGQPIETLIDALAVDLAPTLRKADS